MTSFLLIVSFLLHIVAFIAIYQLYKQTQLPKKEKVSQEMIELFDMYLVEIKEENKRLENTLLEREHDKSARMSEKAAKEKEGDDSYVPPESNDNVKFQTSLQAKVLQMHDQGMSNDEIARNLHSGKTEVDLIVKLHAKNEY